MYLETLVLVHMQSILLVCYVLLLILFAVHRDEFLFLAKRLLRSLLMIVIVICSEMVLI